MRGGAGSNKISTQTIITRAIESGKKHGINLVEGELNKADGNCAFDAVINNINNRECFSNKLLLSSLDYRQVWITELEAISLRYPRLGAGYSKEEKAENWNRLKHSGQYEIDFFGDLVMHAIAKGCNKNILIFNTSPEAADPIYVIEANEFGGSADSKIPVVVAYNQVHYESLHPVTKDDIEKTIDLVKAYVDGTYAYKKTDIPFLISNGSCGNQSSNQCSSKSQPSKICDIEFPSLGSNQSAKSPSKKKLRSEIEGDECNLSLEELKDIPAKHKSKTEAKKSIVPKKKRKYA